MLGNVPSLSRLRRHVSFAEIIEGDVDRAQKRSCERSVMEHLAASGIAVEATAISGDGCSFIIDGRDAARFAAAVQDLNVTVKLHERCARIALTRSSTDWPLPPLKRVMEAFDEADIEIVHLTSDLNALTVLVDEHEADHVVGVFSRFYQPAVTRARAS
jgi:aspartokinase